MKIRHAFAIILLLIVGAFLLTACNETTETPQDRATEALAGFIEIQGSTLYITPVEVFMSYYSDDEYAESFFFQDPALRPIVYVDLLDPQAVAEYGLTEHDFPSGIHIRPNWHADKGWHYVEQANIETLSFEITEDTQFIFVNSQRTQYPTNILDEFLPYLFPSVVHFIEVYDGKVIRLVQEFWFTM